MSILGLEKVVGTAVISDKFRSELLSEHRGEFLSSLDLDPDDVTELQAIQASTPREFYAAVEQIIIARKACRSVHPVSLNESFGRASQEALPAASVSIPMLV